LTGFFSPTAAAVLESTAFATSPVDVLDASGEWAASFRYEPFLDKWFLARPNDAARLSLFATAEIPANVRTAAREQPILTWDQAAYVAPLKAQIQLNRNCNYSCSICYANSMRGKSDYTLSLEELDGLFRYLKAWGVMRVNFVGGEVFMRADFPAIVSLARKHRLLASCITNGRIPGTRIDQYADLLRGMFNVQVSCNGIGKSYEDEYGARDWDVASAAIANVIGATKANILSYVVREGNVDDIPAFLEFADKLRPKQVKFGSICWSGRGERAKALVYYREVLSRARQHVEWGRKRYGHLNIQSQLDLGQEMPAWEEFSNDYRPFEFYFAPEGRDGLYIHASGDIYPFPLLSESGRFKLGNVREDELRTVWETHPTLRQIRAVSFENSACGQAQCRTPCGLWSRSYAVAWSGELRGKVPCSLTDWR